MATMQEIETQARAYAEARKDLVARVSRYQKLKDRLQKRYQGGITKALLLLVEAKQTLKNLIGQSRPLFNSPKTRIFSDVRCGFMKGKGKVSWAKAEEDAVVERIKKYHADLAEQLIIKKEVPSKDALERLLSVKELKRLGVSVQEAGDQVVVRDVDGEMEKLIKALIKGEEEDRAEEAA